MPRTKKPQRRFDPVAPGPDPGRISLPTVAPEAQQLSFDLAGETAATVRPSLLPGRLSAAERWSLAAPRDSFQRLRWDIEQAGGLAQLAAACGVERRVVADHLVLLQRAARRQGQEVSRAS